MASKRYDWSNLKVYQQQTDYTCGVACVRTILGAFGRPVPSEKKLAQILGSTDQDGTRAENMAWHLAEAGLDVEVSSGGTVAQLKAFLRKGYLTIIDWVEWGGHYCVVLDYERCQGYSGGLFTLGDPAARWEKSWGLGRNCVSADRLESMWFDPIPPATKGLFIAARGK